MLKITIITIAFSITILLVKNFNLEISILLCIACGIILLFLSLEFLSPIFDFTQKIAESELLDNEIIKIVFKITAIGYLVEFGAGTVEEIGYKSLSDKLVLVGKIIIIATALPIFYTFLNLITEVFS